MLVFVGLEMAEQAMATAEPRHLKAVALAAVPVVASLVAIETGALIGAAGIDVKGLSPELQRSLSAATMLGNGFIVTAMLWATWLIDLIDGRLGRAALLGGVGAVLTLFGLIHSPFPDGRWIVPWGEGIPRATIALAAGYALMATCCLAFAWRSSGSGPSAPAP